jgi:hypothetical protein
MARAAAYILPAVPGKITTAHVSILRCPNLLCRKCTIHVSTSEGDKILSAGHESVMCSGESVIKSGHFHPIIEDITQIESYVPEQIRNDIYEACRIERLSPKASATLIRRALQGMLRDFWQVKPGRLVDEIKEIEPRVDPVTWQTIDSVRKIGNIGAHMEKDVNMIIDIDENEARLLIELVYTLINDWYTQREARKNRMNSIIAISQNKRNQQVSSQPNIPQQGQSPLMP